MPIIKDGAISTDKWTDVDDAAEIPANEPVIVSLERWLSEREMMLERNSPIGVRIEPGEDLSKLKDDIDRINLIAVVFPRFRDGRGFSYGRLLRERYGFTGELRAVGDILRDQILFLHRCGFDAIEINKDAPAEEWAAAVNEYSIWYQPTGDGRKHVLRQRHN